MNRVYDCKNTLLCEASSQDSNAPQGTQFEGNTLFKFGRAICPA